MTDTTELNKPHALELPAIVEHWFGGTYSVWAGSSLAEYYRCLRWPGSPEFGYHYNDLDFFFNSEAALIAAVSQLLQRGSVPFNSQEERKLHRWLRFGMGDWHTQSIRLMTLDRIEVNLIYKTVDGKPLRTAFEVVNSFDFSNVSHGWDMRTGRKYDLADTYWPGKNPDEVVLFPDREDQWLAGSIGKHTGSRQGKRWAKNMEGLWDVSRTTDVFIKGYRIVAAFYLDKEDDEHHAYADVYLVVADLMERNDYQGVLEIYKGISPHSPIEAIKARLP